MTHDERAKQFVDNLMHKTHLQFQREQLRQDAASSGANALPCPEQRGCKRTASVSERKAQQFKPEWFTHLRPNFWRAYFDTLIYMTK